MEALAPGAGEWVTFQGSLGVLGDHMESLTLGHTCNSPSVSSMHPEVMECLLSLRLFFGAGNTFMSKTDPGPCPWGAHILGKNKRNNYTAWCVKQLGCGQIGAVAMAQGMTSMVWMDVNGLSQGGFAERVRWLSEV